MALAADKDGFLIGEPTEVDTTSMAQALELWRAIGKDVGSIKDTLRSMAGRVFGEAARQRNSTRDRSSAPAASNVATPKRAVSVRTVSQAAQAAAPTRQRQAPVASNVVQLRPEVPRRPMAPRERDARGRFIPAAQLRNMNDGKGKGPVSQEGQEGNDRSEEGGRSGRSTADLARSIGDAIRSSGAEAVNGADQIDPALGAAREAAAIAAPVTGAAKAAGGGLVRMWQDRQERRKRRLDAKENARETMKLQEPWFRRLLKKPAGSDGGMLSGLLSGGGGLLGMLPGLGGAAGVGGLLSKAKLLPRVLGKAMLPLAGVASAVESLNTSTDEYARRMGGTAGESELKDLGYRTAGVLGDLGNFLTFGHADKLGNWLSGGGYTSSATPAAPAKAPNPIAPVQNGTERGLLDLIGKEGGAAGYDAVWNGSKVQPNKPLSQMTLGEVKAWQAQSIKAGSKSSAAGRYQFVSKTLAAQQASAGLKDTDLFNAENQDKLALNLLDANKTSGLTAWREGRATDAQFSDYVASQWALFKNSSGRGTYDGDGLNKASVGSDQVLAAASAMKGGPVVGPQASANDTSPTAKTDSARAVGGPPKPSVAPVSARHSLPTRVPAAGPSASLPAARAGAAPQASQMAVPEAPSTPTQIGSNARGKQPMEVIIPQQLSQNVADRGIAQVATGGMGGSTARGMG